jgi:DNA-binding IclR family transcriptional regulator
MELNRECTFLVLEDLDAVLVERSEDVDGVPLNRPISGRRHWYLTATGKAMVAYQSPSTIKSILDRTGKLNVEDSPKVDELARELGRIRERGYATNAGVRPEGIVSIGVPVIGQAAYAVAGIGTFMPVSELESQEGASIVSQMMSTASRISHYLGYETQIAAAIH